ARTRAALERMARTAWDDPVRRRWLESDRPGLEDYAMFRAVLERFGTGWRDWPARLRDGDIDAADVDPDVIRYHRYAQALLADQMAGLPLDRTEGRGLVLDIPLGVHPDGYDVWRA